MKLQAKSALLREREKTSLKTQHMKTKQATRQETNQFILGPIHPIAKEIVAASPRQAMYQIALQAAPRRLVNRASLNRAALQVRKMRRWLQTANSISGTQSMKSRAILGSQRRPWSLSSSLTSRLLSPSL